MTQELTTVNSMQSYCFSSAENFEAAQRMATALSKATLIPKEYINNIPNCIIALEVAHRLNASPTMVMQNLYIVHGKPSWSSQFIISAINSCGRFTPLQFNLDGEGDNWGCYVTTKDKYGELLKGPRVDIKMAKSEGWYNKTGSKWQTMPEMMLRYRAASFFGRLYAPDVLMGMHTHEENEEIAQDVTPRNNNSLRDALIKNETEVSTQNPNALVEILSHEKPAIAELVMLDGEVKNFPTQIDTVRLMTMFQDMPTIEKKSFIENNSSAFPKILEFMKVDGKPLAVESLKKIISNNGA